jgi:hypothetical protein
VKTIVAQEGIGGIYKGLVPTMMKQSTNQATRFLVYTELKKWFQEGDAAKQLTVTQNLFSGGNHIFLLTLQPSPEQLL